MYLKYLHHQSKKMIDTYDSDLFSSLKLHHDQNNLCDDDADKHIIINMETEASHIFTKNIACEKNQCKCARTKSCENKIIDFLNHTTRGQIKPSR